MRTSWLGTTGRSGSPSRPGMDEREVAEVGEVLDLARGVALPGIRPAGHRVPVVGLELGNVGERPARILERDPDDPVALLAAKRRRARLGGNARRVGQLRDGGAGAARPVPPAVVGADDLVAFDRAERQRRPAMDAEVGEGVDQAGRVAPEDERLGQEVGRNRTVAERLRVGDGVPAGAKRLMVATCGWRVGAHAPRTSTWSEPSFR